MNFLANKSFVFLADRYEEWMSGACISQGPVSAKITADASEDGITFNVEGADSLRMQKQVTFALITENGPSVDLGKRLQYLNPFFCQENPLEAIVCHVFYEGRTISYIRFGMSYPDRIIEFYGKTVSFDGLAMPEVAPGKRLSFKKSFIDGIADQYRELLKENTVTLAIVDHQMACVAFSLKMYQSLLAMTDDSDGKLKDQVFTDTSSTISTFYPIFGNEALDIAKSWFNQLVDSPRKAEVFLNYYFGQLEAGEPIDGWKIQNALGLL